jgi:CTP:molybdopterin cytidylyltransferase MocA
MTAAVAAILAAAGKSQRMGSCKQLLHLAGRTVLARCIETLRAGGIADISVVVGLQGEAVSAEANLFPVQVAVNEDPDGDMASSVLTGLRTLPPAASGVLVALCDYPLVTAQTITSLVAAHSAAPEAILIPCHEGRRGHPTLFPAECLSELKPGLTLRDIVRRDSGRVRMIAVADPGIFMDMDRPEEYLAVREKFEALHLAG